MTFNKSHKYCIYTAIFGDYDSLKEPRFEVANCDFICFTDNPNLQSKYYKIHVVKSTNKDPVRSAKIYKILPHKYLKDYEYSLWVDGSVTIQKLNFQEIVDKYLKTKDIALFKHPVRDCIYEEFEECKRLRKDDVTIMNKQIKKYRMEGYPSHAGLAEGTVILRRHNSANSKKLCEAWWKEISQHSRRDQLSFNYVSWKTGIKYSHIQGTTKDNAYLSVSPHRIIRNELTTKEYIEMCKKYHQLGRDHDALFKEKTLLEKSLAEYADNYHKIGKDHDILIKKFGKVESERDYYKKNHLEAMKQRNDFECQLQNIYKSPKWKIANLIVLPFKPFKKIASKVTPYIQELYHSVKDINGYKKNFGASFAKEKLEQLIGLYTKSLKKKYSKEKGQRTGVLFLSDEQSNCYRYRVLNQMEQLDSKKIFAKDVSVNFPRLHSLIDIFDVFIFVRPHDTAKNLNLAKIIRKQKKIIIFENDDLIFSKDAIKESGILANLPKNLKNIYEDGIGTKFVKLANYGLTTTLTIQKEMERAGLKVFVNRNALNTQVKEISKKLLEDKNADDFIDIGYFSGSKTHNEDFNVAKDSVIKVLEKYNNVRILVAGHIDLGKEFEKFKERILCLPFVNWKELPKNIIKADINIVPLKNSLFNQSKSELKYFEAGILKIPTIASATDPYKYAIKDEVNGFLAKDGTEWFNKLDMLIKDEKLRKEIGEEAYRHTLQNYTANKRKGDFTSFIISTTSEKK